jgi:GAF domain-containing protein
MPDTIPATSDLHRLQARIDALEQERGRMLALVEILRDITGAMHYPDIVQAVTRRLGHFFGLDRCSVFLAARAGGPDVHLVASYEDPSIRNHLVDLARYPEVRRAIETGQVVHIPDAGAEPALAAAEPQLTQRRVRSIMVVPMTWHGHVIGTLFLRTDRDGPAFQTEDMEFCRVVAEVTARALRMAHRLERLQARHGSQALLVADRERAALLGFLRRLLGAYGDRERSQGEALLPRVSGQELDRLVGVALTVIGQEARVTQESRTS